MPSRERTGWRDFRWGNRGGAQALYRAAEHHASPRGVYKRWKLIGAIEEIPEKEEKFKKKSSSVRCG